MFFNPRLSGFLTKGLSNAVTHNPEDLFRNGLSGIHGRFQLKKETLKKMKGPIDVMNMSVMLKGSGKVKLNSVAKAITKEDSSIVLDLFDPKTESEVLKSIRDSFPDFTIKKEAHLIVVKPGKVDSDERRLKDLNNEYIETIRNERREFLKKMIKSLNEDEQKDLTRIVDKLVKEYGQKLL